jgi:hypothetical protein
MPGGEGLGRGGVMMSTSFARIAGWCAVLAGVAALVYSCTFAVVVQDGDRWAQWTATIVLATGAAAALPVLVALYLRARIVDEGFAIVALLVGAVAAAGSLLHATFDLGVLANEPAQQWDYPSPTDPRGFATFLLTGVAIGLLSSLVGRAGAPRALVRIGWATAVLLAWVWIGRLTALDPKEPWVAPAVVGSGFIGVPLWYAWIGWLLLHDRLTAPDADDAPVATARDVASTVSVGAGTGGARLVRP